MRKKNHQFGNSQLLDSLRSLKHAILLISLHRVLVNYGDHYYYYYALLLISTFPCNSKSPDRIQALNPGGDLTQITHFKQEDESVACVFASYPLAGPSMLLDRWICCLETSYIGRWSNQCLVRFPNLMAGIPVISFTGTHLSHSPTLLSSLLATRNSWERKWGGKSIFLDQAEFRIMRLTEVICKEGSYWSISFSQPQPRCHFGIRNNSSISLKGP